jgi:curved DNA-binding protein CbpA
MHPDKFFADPERHAEAIEQLKDLNAIMRVLRDPIQRAEYDALLLSDRVPPLTRRMAAMRIKR